MDWNALAIMFVYSGMIFCCIQLWRSSERWKRIARKHGENLMAIAGLKGQFKTSHASLIVFSRCETDGGVWMTTQYIKLDPLSKDHDPIDEDLQQMSIDWFNYIQRCELEIPGFH